jgi:hypothetical protein
MRIARRGDDGFAMIATIIVIVVAAMLAAVILTEGDSANHSSGNDKNWTVALHVADSGVERSIAYLQTCLQTNLPAACVSPPSGSTPDGSYALQMTYKGRYKWQIDSVGTVGTVSSLQRKRALRVIVAPPVSFKYALFSDSDINTKNNDVVNGDVWANGSVEVYNGNSVNGSVNAAQGAIHLDSQSCVSGDVHSGGFTTDINTGAVYSILIEGGPTKNCNVPTNTTNIGGNATASSSIANCGINAACRSNYNIVNNGVIAGKATACGSVTGSGTASIWVTNFCNTLAPAKKPMPTFNANFYSPPNAQQMSVAQFQAYVNANQSNLSGAFRVWGPGTINLSGTKVGGDLTIVAVDENGTNADPQNSAQIDADDMSAANNSDKVLVLYSAWQGAASSLCDGNGGNPGYDGNGNFQCALGTKNNFSPSDNTATLLYAPNGPCLFKNNADFNGAVYCANIVLKNDQTTTYDERVEQIVGFGQVTLQITSWQEQKV